ncbi:MAG TPA: TonB-dependent receptor [Allosphingosinicella sp.]|jgi:hypothetical protein|uniref:TonB-dependent receptor n=1 Tax=Allosphingosinicella sp. TaxID=2823234 RepID=UPI002F29ACA7
MNRISLLCATAALVMPVAVYAQETTADIRGTVVTAGAPVADAEVVITHVPTGAVSRVNTDTQGNFGASGLRFGGPYTIVVTAPGAAAFTYPEELNLTAGDVARLDIDIAATAETAEAGEEIVVTGTRNGGASVSLGPVTVLNRDAIEGVASINRDVRDLVRRSPFAQVDLSNSRAFSIAGQNPRFNRFSVDGVQFSDDFGLNNGGLPTSRGPVPLDAICQFSVSVAPADITEGDFQGGAVNTQLCTGTNRFTGGAFFTYNDDNLTGDKSRGTRLDLDLNNKSYGAFLRGPIIRDRLFFAVAWERTRETEPTDIGPAGEGFGTVVPNVSRAQIDQISSIAQSVYGFDTGDVLRNLPEEDDRVTARLDLNISDNHRASLTYIYNNGTQAIEASNDTRVATPRLGLFSNTYTLKEVVHSGVAQLNSDWSDTFSTEARVSFRDYNRDQTPPFGREFGEFTVCLDQTSTGSLTGCSTNQGSIRFGPDVSRQANELDTRNLNIQLQANLQAGAHTFKFLAERTDQDVYNLFLQRASGSFYFDSITDFQAGRANQLDLAQSTTGDINGAAAIFDYQNFTFGVQDSWDVTDNLNLIMGLRYELYAQDVRPALNQSFLSRYGFSNRVTINGRDVLLPRFGLSWRASDRLRVIATAGRFAAGTPDVYISNSYSNTGVTQNRVTINRTATGFQNAPTNIGIAALNDVRGAGPGIPDIVTQFVQSSTTALPNATTNAIDPEFDIPVQWRFSGSVSYNADLGFLGDNWFFAVDGIYGFVDKGIDYVDLRAAPVGTTPDGRTRYGPFAGTSGNNSDILLTNHEEGESIIAVARFDKQFDNGFSLGGSYTFQDIEDRNPLTSSVAFSNYANQATRDPNGSTLGTSNEQIRHSVKFNLGYRREFFANAETRIDIFGEWRKGRPYSYTFDANPTNASGRDQVFGVFGNDDRHLLYVPASGSDVLVQYANTTTGTGANTVITQTAAQTQQLLNDFIDGTKLRNFRGQIAPKNIGRSPNFTKIDLRIAQDIPTFGFGKVKLFADVENVLNLIDSDWGSLRQVRFPYTTPLVDVQCVAAGTNPCAQYRYSNFRAPNEELFTRVSLWQVRLGVRFEF